MTNCVLQLLVCDPNVNEKYPQYTPQSTDSGFDLYFPKDVTIIPGVTSFVSLGVKARVMKGDQAMPFWLAPRSSISKTKIRMANSMGIIDSTYRGELIVALDNISNEFVTIEAGKRLFQICSCDLTPFERVEKVDSLDETERGSGGFGSTGQS